MVQSMATPMACVTQDYYFAPRFSVLKQTKCWNTQTGKCEHKPGTPISCSQGAWRQLSLSQLMSYQQYLPPAKLDASQIWIEVLESPPFAQVVIPGSLSLATVEACSTAEDHPLLVGSHIFRVIIGFGIQNCAKTYLKNWVCCEFPPQSFPVGITSLILICYSRKLVRRRGWPFASQAIKHEKRAIPRQASCLI